MSTEPPEEEHRSADESGCNPVVESTEPIPEEPSQKPNPSRTSRLLLRMSEPVSAFVIDLFRVSVGLLVSVYFLRLFLEFSDYSSESGFLDHALHRHLFWFTKLSLIFPGSPELYKLSLLSLGALGAVALTIGWRPKLGAAVAWIVAVSFQSWNFAVINVDDSSITLLLWWMLFLPIGHCLTIHSRDLKSEVVLRVNGFFVRAFFANLFIYYLTAGLSKLASPLWREGLALFVVLKLPLARTSGWWDIQDLPFLWFGNHLTLLLEPLFPFLIFLPKGHPIKWLGGLTQIGFHLSIPLTIGVPYANFTLILALILVFHRELDDLLRKWARRGDSVTLSWSPPKGTRGLIGVYLFVLALTGTKGIPGIGGVNEPAMAALYFGGVAQEYHLFDWIDRYNWYVDHRVTVEPAGKPSVEVEESKLFPASVRGFIVQSYLMPVRWMRVPRPLTGEMRNSILLRSAERFLRENREVLGDSGTVSVRTTVGRVSRDNLNLDKTWQVELMTFTYGAQGVQEFLYPRLPKSSQELR